MTPYIRRFFARFGIALVTVTMIVASGLWAVNREIDSRLAGINRVDVTVDDPGPAEAANYLIIGSDSRAFAAREGSEANFGDPSKETGQRSDVIMIAHVEPAQKKVLLVSIPRDLWVNVPGMGFSKINAAFNAGPEKTIETIRDQLGVPINHYFSIGFDGVMATVDAVGAVPVFFPAPARDKETGLDQQAGCQALAPEQALAYVRSRHYEQLIDGKWREDPTADLGRIKRQQDFLRRLGAMAVKKGLNNPQTALNVVDGVSPYLQADQALDKKDIFRAVNAFRSVDPNDPERFETITLPTRAPRSGEVRTGGQSVLVLDQPAANEVLGRLRDFSAPAEDAPATSISPAQVQVRVLNGSGTAGLASKTAGELQAAGFAPAGTGNSPRKVNGTEIRYRAGAEEKARLVLRNVGGVGKIVSDNSVSDADVVLVIGADFAGVKAESAPTPAPAAPPAAPAVPAAAPAAPAAPAPDPNGC